MAIIVDDILRPNYKIAFPDPKPRPIIGRSEALNAEFYDSIWFQEPVFDQFELPFLEMEEVLLSVSQGKNIVETPLAGRDGEVFEYISKASHVITMRGRLVDPNIDVRPDDKIRQLMEWCEYPDRFEIKSTFLTNFFGIKFVIIKDYDFPQTEGFRNVQDFRIILKEDVGEEIIITEVAT